MLPITKSHLMNKFTLAACGALITAFTGMAGNTVPVPLTPIGEQQNVAEPKAPEIVKVENNDEMAKMPVKKLNEADRGKYVGTVSFDDVFVSYASMSFYLDYEVSDSYDVYKTINQEGKYVYTIAGLFGTDIQIINDPSKPSSVIPDQKTQVAVPEYYTDYSDVYDTFTVYSYESYMSPCMNKVTFNVLCMQYKNNRSIRFNNVTFYFNLIEGEGFATEFDKDVYNNGLMPNPSVHFTYSPGAPKVEINILRYCTLVSDGSRNYGTTVYSQTHALSDSPENRFDLDIPELSETGVYQVQVQLLNDQEHYLTELKYIDCYTMGTYNRFNVYEWENMGNGLYKVNTELIDDNLVSTFREVEIERNNSSTGMYRIVNPFEHLGLPDFKTREPNTPGVYYDYRYSGKDGNNYYLLFGPNKFSTDFNLPNGVIFVDAKGNVKPWMSKHLYNTEIDINDYINTIMPCFAGQASLPGAENFEISIDQAGRALYATPQTDVVTFTKLTAAQALELPEEKTATEEALIATLKKQIKDGNCVNWLVSKESDYRVKLDLSEDEFVAVYAIAKAPGGQEKWSGLFRFAGTRLDGAYEVPVQPIKDWLAPKCDLAATATDPKMRVWVNPLDRDVMCIDNMFEFAKTGTSTDWKVDEETNRLWLRFTEYGFALSCNAEGEIAPYQYYDYDERRTGLMYLNNPAYPYVTVDFMPSPSYRSGFSLDRIWSDITSGAYDPQGVVMKYGKTVVFEPYSMYFSGACYLGHFPYEMVIPFHSPTQQGEQQTVKPESNGQYTVPAHVTTVRYLLQSQQAQQSAQMKANGREITFSEFMRDPNMGETAEVTVGDDGVCHFTLPQQQTGSYTLFMAAHDAEGNVVDAHQGTYEQGQQGVDNIVTDTTDAPAEYYNLQGVRIDNPTPGSVVIMKQGTRATKVRY